MAKKSRARKPWETRWEMVEENLGKGGQGTTHVVRDRESGALGVLKVQNYGKARKDPERRGRFRREAVALETLDHPRIPKLIDTNADHYRELDVELFMVQEHVDGSNLAEYVETNSCISTEVAIEMTTRLLDAVAYCHTQEIGHRDVKPDNVVLRANDPADPVLVDFGQSFPTDEDLAGSMVTHDAQVMGNRFLALPELTSGTGKRDFRSDLTHLAGILLFSVTGLLPMQLLDGERNRPHRQPDAAKVLGAIERGALLDWFFDRAFRYRPSARFQDHAEFANALGHVANGGDLPLEAILAPVNNQFAASIEVQVKKTKGPLLGDLRNEAKFAGKKVHAGLTQVKAHTVPPKNTTDVNGVHRITFGVGINVGDGTRAEAAIWLLHDGEFFRIRAGIPGGDESMLRIDTPISDPSLPPDFRDRLARILGMELARIIAV